MDFSSKSNRNSRNFAASVGIGEVDNRSWIFEVTGGGTTGNIISGNDFIYRNWSFKYSFKYNTLQDLRLGLKKLVINIKVLVSQKNKWLNLTWLLPPSYIFLNYYLNKFPFDYIFNNYNHIYFQNLSNHISIYLPHLCHISCMYLLSILFVLPFIPTLEVVK